MRDGADVMKDIESVLARVPVFGTAPATALADGAPGYRPADLLPGALSIFCFAVPMPRGVYDSGKPIEMYWRALPMRFRAVDDVSLQIAAIIEESGFMSSPVFACFPLERRHGGELWGTASLMRMAAACGIGTIGKNGLLFNSRYGPRLILGGVVTTATLPPTCFPQRDEEGCPEDCSVCQDNCPIHAIDRNGKVNNAACSAYSTQPSLLTAMLQIKEYKPEELRRLLNTAAVDEHNMNVCTACVSSCPNLGGRGA
jgi:epoxyqueuosine reductase QueG